MNLETQRCFGRTFGKKFEVLPHTDFAPSPPSFENIRMFQKKLHFPGLD